MIHDFSNKYITLLFYLTNNLNPDFCSKIRDDSVQKRTKMNILMTKSRECQYNSAISITTAVENNQTFHSPLNVFVTNAQNGNDLCRYENACVQ